MPFGKPWSPASSKTPRRLKWRCIERIQKSTQQLEPWFRVALALEEAEAKDPRLKDERVASVDAACQAEPRSQGLCVRATQLYGQAGKPELAALGRVGPPARRTNEALLVTALITRATEPKKAMEQLQAYVEATAFAFQQSQAALRQHAERVQERLVGQARAGNIPSELKRQLEGVSDEKPKSVFEPGCSLRWRLMRSCRDCVMKRVDTVGW